jgi:hypothetical protein
MRERNGVLIFVKKAKLICFSILLSTKVERKAYCWKLKLLILKK